LDVGRIFLLQKHEGIYFKIEDETIGKKLVKRVGEN